MEFNFESCAGGITCYRCKTASSDIIKDFVKVEIYKDQSFIESGRTVCGLCLRQLRLIFAQGFNHRFSLLTFANWDSPRANLGTLANFECVLFGHPISRTVEFTAHKIRDYLTDIDRQDALAMFGEAPTFQEYYIRCTYCNWKLCTIPGPIPRPRFHFYSQRSTFKITSHHSFLSMEEWNQISRNNFVNIQLAIP